MTIFGRRKSGTVHDSTAAAEGIAETSDRPVAGISNYARSTQSTYDTDVFDSDSFDTDSYDTDSYDTDDVESNDPSFDSLFEEFTARAHAAGLSVPPRRGKGRRTLADSTGTGPEATAEKVLELVPAVIEPAGVVSALPASAAPVSAFMVPPSGAPFGVAPRAAVPAEAPAPALIPAAEPAPVAAPAPAVVPASVPGNSFEEVEEIFRREATAFAAPTFAAPPRTDSDYEVKAFDLQAYANGGAVVAPALATVLAPVLAPVATTPIPAERPIEPATTPERFVAEEAVEIDAPDQGGEAEEIPVPWLPEIESPASVLPPVPTFEPAADFPVEVPSSAAPIVVDESARSILDPAPSVDTVSHSFSAVTRSFEETSRAFSEPVEDVEFELGTLNSLERDALDKADEQLVAALQQVVLQRASDLHVTSDSPPMLRIDGALRPVQHGALAWPGERVSEALHSLLSEAQSEKFAENLELDFAFTISANARFRVNFYQQRGSVGAAFRLIPTEIKTLEQLGVPEHIGGFAALPRGLVLVTGPTGSGKSTTLAALIDLANRTRADHIVTVEDPIEFLHQHKKSLVNQREVGHDTFSFAAALKHVLRQDPDVILIGELRDLETISVALTAAETGHLVFATLHTQDAPQTIDRMIDVFPPHQQAHVRAQLADTLQGVVCQTLVKRTGGKGRVVATEVMMTTPAIANLIREGKTFQISSMMQAGRDLGMHTLDQHLADLVNAGAITQQAARDKARDLDGLTRMISGVDSPTESAARAIHAGGIDFGDAYSAAAR